MSSSLKIIIFTLVIVAVITLFIIVKFNIGDDSLSKNNFNHMEKLIKECTLAGSFFPAEAEELKQMLDNFLEKVEDKNYLDLRAIIVPHAGLIYSGQTAAYAYQQVVNQKINKIILLGPTHHQYTNKIALLHADEWETPLGNIILDTEIISQLEKDDNFEYFDQAFVQENSLETQLPFIHKIFPKAKLIPLAVGVLNSEQIQSASEKFLNIIDENTLLIISTDLSHYYPVEQAKEIDQKCLDSIQNLEFDLECEACGEMGLKILFQIAQKLNWQAEVLNYSHSGEISGDPEVVGYVSAILSGEVKAPSEGLDQSGGIEKNEYSQEEREYLLKLARDTIDYAFKNGGKLMPLENIPDKFKEKRGVFVTLHKESKLRGCIGYIEAVEEIYKAVQSNALSAAFKDHRFNPLEEKELKDCEIEISILTVPQKTELAKIKENIDGVIIKQGRNQATYLPQVWEDISGPAEFYGSLCIKAGLQADCYTDPETEFYKYQAEVFYE